MRSFWMFFNNWFYSNYVWVSNSFWLISNYFWLFYWFCVFLNKWLKVFFSIARIRSFFYLFICEQQKIFFYQAFHWITTIFLRKSNSFRIIFKNKLFDFIDWHLFIALAVFRIYVIICRKTQNKKKKKMIL